MYFKNFSDVNVGDKFFVDGKWWVKEDENETPDGTNSLSDEGDIAWFGPNKEVEVEE